MFLRIFNILLYFACIRNSVGQIFVLRSDSLMGFIPSTDEIMQSCNKRIFQRLTSLRMRRMYVKVFKILKSNLQGAQHYTSIIN